MSRLECLVKGISNEQIKAVQLISSVMGIHEVDELKNQPVILREVFFYDENNNVEQYNQYYSHGD